MDEVPQERMDDAWDEGFAHGYSKGNEEGLKIAFKDGYDFGAKTVSAKFAAEIEQLREENRMYWTRYWNMAQAFERRGNALHRIASMRSDPEFGVPPIMTVQKIAQEALLKEKV